MSSEGNEADNPASGAFEDHHGPLSSVIQPSTLKASR